MKIETLDPENFKKFWDLLMLSRKLRSLMDKFPSATRRSVPANDLYDLVVEVVEMVRFHVSEDHFRSGQENPEIIFRLDQADELGNAKSYRIRKKSVVVAPAQTELEGLNNVLTALISLKRNRTEHSLNISFHDRKKAKKRSSRRRKKRWFYINASRKK